MQQTSVRALKYDSYHDPLRAISAGCLEGLVLDCMIFGAKRYRQRYRAGRDWKREIRKMPNHVPEIYQQLQALLWFLYSLRFGLMCDMVGLDPDQVRDRLLIMLTGEPLDVATEMHRD